MLHNAIVGSRRNFLKAAALSVGSSMVPKTVQGANDKINLGIIGVGGRGTLLLRELVRIQDDTGTINIAKVCDVYTRRILDAEELSGGVGTNDYREILADKSIDAVVIATPDHWHAKMATEACEAGKDVFVEKPMTRTFDEAKALWQTVEKTNRVLQVGSQHASNNLYHKAAQVVQSGLLGKVVMSHNSWDRNTIEGEWNYKIDPEAGPNAEGDNHIDWDMWLGDAPKVPYDPEHYFRFRKYWDYSSGVATDLFYHLMTMLSTSWGESEFPTRASHVGGIWQFKDREVPDTCIVTMDFPKEHSVVLTGTMANNTNTPLLIKGHEGTISMSPSMGSRNSFMVTPQSLFADGFRERADAAGIKGTWSERPDRRGTITELEVPKEVSSSHLENFIDCVRSRQKPNLDALMGFKIMAGIDMAVQSYKTGKTIYFDEKKMEMTDEPINI
jgi:predicted dehydrogenase